MTSVHQPYGEVSVPFYSDCNMLFDLAISHAANCADRSDLIVAHVLFNLAAKSGHCEASERRREIADEMSAAEIVAAQWAARVWLSKQNSGTGKLSDER